MKPRSWIDLFMESESWIWWTSVLIRSILTKQAWASIEKFFFGKDSVSDFASYDEPELSCLTAKCPLLLCRNYYGRWQGWGGLEAENPNSSQLLRGANVLQHVIYSHWSDSHITTIGWRVPHRSPESLDEVGISGVNAEDEYWGRWRVVCTEGESREEVSWASKKRREATVGFC